MFPRCISVPLVPTARASHQVSGIRYFKPIEMGFRP